jgi:hypothetical protein
MEMNPSNTSGVSTIKLSSKDRAKDKRLREIYNRSLEDQNAQRAEQKNACAICRRPFNQFTAFQDHDHKCCPRRLKKFCGLCNRGLLCYLCNKYAVGLIEWMRKMDIPMQKVVDYCTFWDGVIAAKGGYAPKEKVKSPRKRTRRKQTSVRRSPEPRPDDGATMVVSEPRSQPGINRIRRVTQSRKA